MSTTKPLEGIKVIEISTIITASLSAMMLSDQGAEVIKIEQTGSVSYTHLTLPTICSV